MTRYTKPCPNPLKGERCPLCGGSWVCLQPNRPKQAPAQKAAPQPTEAPGDDDTKERA